MRGRWYRWNKKSTTDEMLALDMAKFANAVDVTRRYAGSWQWTSTSGRKSSISYVVEPSKHVRLSYTSNGEPYNYAVPLTTTTPTYGGVRWWWQCPRCQKRVRILYGGRLFLCRQCQNLAYETAQKGGDLLTTIDSRLYFIRDKLGGKWHFLHGPGEKPKYMHWETYGRLAREYVNLLKMRNYAWVAEVAAIAEGLPGADENESMSLDEVREGVMAEWEYHKAHPDRFHYVPRPAVDDTEGDYELNRLTLGELAQRAGVPYAFAKEAQAEGMINADKGRNSRRKRYRERLKNWLRKLHTLRESGMSWEEIQAWTKRRFQPGHEHERVWPAGHSLKKEVGR